MRRLCLLLPLLAGCAQIIGADFSEPAEISDSISPGKTDGDEPTIQGYATSAAFCDELARALCSASVVTTCWQGLDCNAAVAGKCIERMGSNRGYLGQDAKNCVSRVASSYKDLTLFGPSEKFNTVQECQQAFGRFARKGEPCTGDSDCLDKEFSDPEMRCLVTGPNARTCAVRDQSGLADGQVCAGSTCQSTSYCDASEATPTCKPRQKTEGASCPAPDGCDDSTSTNLRCLSGVCSRYIGTNPSELTDTMINKCTSDEACNGSYCVGGKCVVEMKFTVNDTDGSCQALRDNPLIGTR